MKIKQKIAVIILLVSVIPALLISFFNISGVIGISETPGRNKVVDIAGLEVISKLEADSIKTVFQSVKGYATILEDSVVIRENFLDLEKFSGDTSVAVYKEAKEQIDNRFANWIHSQSWASDIMITDAFGRVIYTFDNDRIETKLGASILDFDSDAFENGKKMVYVGSVFLHKHAEEVDSFPEVFVYAPMNDSNGVFIGEIVLAVKMNIIYKFIEDYVGMGETGELMLFEERNGEIKLLNPLRFDSHAALKNWSMSDPELPQAVKLSLSGNDGAGAFIDYRGHAVSGAWRYIPELRWMVIGKMDTAELLKEFNGFRDINIFILIIFVFISMAVAIYFAKSILSPITGLTHTLTEISKGRFDVEIEKIDTKDEVGELARAFERVIVSLKLAMRDLGETKLPEVKAKKIKFEEAQKEVETAEVSKKT